MNIRQPILCLVLLLAACAPTGNPTLNPNTPVTSPPQDSPTEDPQIMPYEPQPADSALLRENIFIEEMGLLIRESYPPQIALSVSGNLPTPCHQLRATASQPDAENKISVDVYAVADPNMACVQVLSPFSETIELGSFPSGHYSVWVNGELAGEFDS
jgi:hypothetical protein